MSPRRLAKEAGTKCVTPDGRSSSLATASHPHNTSQPNGTHAWDFGPYRQSP